MSMKVMFAPQSIIAFIAFIISESLFYIVTNVRIKMLIVQLWSVNVNLLVQKFAENDRLFYICDIKMISI